LTINSNLWNSNKHNDIDIEENININLQLQDHRKDITSIKINKKYIASGGKDGVMNVYSVDNIVKRNIKNGKIADLFIFRVV